MPEIWLKYGTTDIVLDIKFENLLKHVSSDYPLLTDDEIKSALKDVIIGDNTLILALSGSRSVAKIITTLSQIAQLKGYEKLTVDVFPDIAEALKMYITDTKISLRRIDYLSLQERLGRFQNVIFISHVTYDPLFGFGGTPTLVLRNFMKDRMSEAFKSRQNDLPSVGNKGTPLQIALSYCENIPALSIEVVANYHGIAGIYYGNILQSFNDAVTKLSAISTIKTESTKSAIISMSCEIPSHLTLTNSLNTLWNSSHIVKEGGSVVLIAENKLGIGGGALQMFIEGKLNIEDSRKSNSYIDGLEHLIFLEALKQKYDLGILSTIPQYYLRTLLGFTTYSGTKDILQHLLTKHGKNNKVLAVSDGDEILLKAIL
jgi:hypothetical protein